MVASGAGTGASVAGDSVVSVSVVFVINDVVENIICSIYSFMFMMRGES